MRNIGIICRRELGSFYTTWIAYSLLARFTIVFGYMFFVAVAIFVSRGMEMQSMGQSVPMNVNEWVVGPLFMNMSVLSLFLIPMIGMKLFAEEKSTGTIELLLTSPVRDTEIVVGKWLGGLACYTAIIGISVILVGLLFLVGNPDPLPVLAGYVGLILQGGCLMAICTFLSSITRNQIIAADAGFTICLLLWVLDWPSAYQSGVMVDVLSFLSLARHLQPFTTGVINSKDIFYYAAVIFFFLFLTKRAIESTRWRA